MIPDISKSFGKAISTIQIKPILITNVNNPKVRNLKGRVIVFKIGLTKKLIPPRILPIMINIYVSPKNDMPGIKRADKKIPNIPAKILKNNPVTIKSIISRFCPKVNHC